VVVVVVGAGGGSSDSGDGGDGGGGDRVEIMVVVMMIDCVPDRSTRSSSCFTECVRLACSRTATRAACTSGGVAPFFHTSPLSATDDTCIAVFLFFPRFGQNAGGVVR
jgi:hypothetical protein